MLQLIYVSTAVRPMDGKALARILRTARDNNEALGVTGLLLYKGRHFMQILEGDAEAVRNLFATIADDPRHEDVVVLYEDATDVRDFGAWSMAFSDVDCLTEEDREAFDPFLDHPLTADDFADDPVRTHRLLVNFKSKLRAGVE